MCTFLNNCTSQFISQELLMHCVMIQGLAAMRDRLSKVVTGKASKTSQLEERLKVLSAQLCMPFS